MKKYISFVFLLVFCELSFAQTPYQYVIIPTRFSEFGSGFNPYELSSSIQRILTEKSIKCTIESAEKSDNYCDALIVGLEKTSTAFRNKLIIELKDCQNRTVWRAEGKGISKSYNEGYAEALAEALEELKELPVNNTTVSHAVASVEIPEVIETDENEAIYKPKNLYFNDTYFVDLLAGDDGLKKIIIINGKLLGYKNLQKIATLTPSGLGDSYFVHWITPQGTSISGVANFTETKLNISLSMGDKPVVIIMMKQ